MGFLGLFAMAVKHRKRPLRFLLAGTGVALGLWVGGCAAVVPGELPNRLIGADGQRFAVEDLTEIANDPDLDEAGKRQAFRDLGIEDEELIDALLGL